MGIIKLNTIEELDGFHNEIAKSFSPCDDRDCPLFSYDNNRENIRKEGNFLTFKDSNGIERVLENIPKGAELDLSKLDEGDAVYFFGRQGPAYYTLKIADNGMVKAWRDCDANALLGPTNRITSRENTPIFYEGVLKKDLHFVMPYFIYNTDGQFCQDDKTPKIKEVLQPIETYFGGFAFLALEKVRK